MSFGAHQCSAPERAGLSNMGYVCCIYSLPWRRGDIILARTWGWGEDINSPESANPIPENPEGPQTSGTLTVLGARADDLSHAHGTPFHVLVIALGWHEGAAGEGRPERRRERDTAAVLEPSGGQLCVCWGG